MDNKNINSALSTVQKFYIEFMGAFIPGFVFLFMAIALGSILYVLFGGQIDLLKNAIPFLTNWYMISFLIVFSYILGAILYRKTPKRPDRIASFKQFCMTSKKEREFLAVQYNVVPPASLLAIVRFSIKIFSFFVSSDWNRVKSIKTFLKFLFNSKHKWKIFKYIVCYVMKFFQSLLCRILFTLFPETFLSTVCPDAGYPYPYFKKYLDHRKKQHLSQYIIWGDNSDALAAKSKQAINDLKSYVSQFGTDRQFTSMVRNEAHIRLMTSIWYAMLYLQRVFIVAVIIWFLLKVCNQWTFEFLSKVCNQWAFEFLSKVFNQLETDLLKHSPYIVCLFAIGVVIFWIKYGVESSLHYVRTREIVLILESVFVINHINTSFSPAETCLQEIINGKPESKTIKRELLIHNKANKMITLANAIMKDYKSEGYETQELEVKDDGYGNKGYIVQIRNTSDNAGGFLKKMIGCETCVSLILTAKGNNLEVKVAGGKWLDKAAVIGVSMIVLWPLLITGTIGSFRQKALLDKLFINAIEKLASDRV